MCKECEAKQKSINGMAKKRKNKVRRTRRRTGVRGLPAMSGVVETVKDVALVGGGFVAGKYLDQKVLNEIDKPGTDGKTKNTYKAMIKIVGGIAGAALMPQNRIVSRICLGIAGAGLHNLAADAGMVGIGSLDNSRQRLIAAQRRVEFAGKKVPQPQHD